MELFKCCRCKTALPIEEFGGVAQRSDYCKACIRESSREWSEKNRERRRAINNKAAAKRYRINREELSRFLLAHPCVDCNEGDPVVLEFDHRSQETKRAQVGDMLGSCSWTTILTEIAKCEVRCSNCHRRRTARQLGWYKGGDAK